MVINLGMNWENFYRDNIMSYIKSLQQNPFELVTLILDSAIVIFLVYCFFKIVKGSRAWQLIKGIALLVITTWVSGLLNLNPELRVAGRLADGIVVIKLFPGLSEQILRSMLSAPGLRAVVLETFGAGNAPTSEWFIRVLHEAIQRGVIILNITQCGGGRVSMELYETGLRLQKAGVLCGYDMTTEAAVAKLMYVLGLGLPDEECRALLRQPLRGEFTA